MDIRKLHIFPALLLLAAFCLQAGAATVESNLSHRRFTTTDGLPQMQTEAVWQDSRGYIYIGTLSGFVRYNGRTLTPFLGGRRENIVAFQETADRVRALGFVRQWTVSGKELKMSTIDPEGRLLLNNLNSSDLPPGYILLEDRQERGRVICRLAAGGTEPVLESPTLDEMTPDRKVFLDSTGIYIPTPKGLFLSSGGSMRRISSKPDVFSIVRSGTQIVALAADGLYTVMPEGLTQICAHRFEAPDYGLFVRRNRQGQLLIADSHTIWRYDAAAAGPMQQLATGFNLIRGIFIDRWNRLWAATYQGAYCFFQCNFTSHRLTDRNDIVRAAAFSGNSLVTGTLNGKIMADGQVLDASDDQFYAPGAVSIDGTVYMAGNGDVAAVSGGTVRRLGLPGNDYRFVSRAGRRLVIGTRSSLLAYDPRTSRLDTLTSEIQRSWCAAADGEGRLWVGGNPGLFCLTGLDGGGTSVRKVKSTPNAQIITTMASDNKGQVCFARGDSLFCISKGRIRHLDEFQKCLSGHEIRSVHISAGGYLIAAAIDALMVARFPEEGPSSEPCLFNSENGFSIIEPQMSPMAEDEEGTVWLCGLEEMVSFKPSELVSDSQESTIVEPPRPWWKSPWFWVLCAALLSAAVWNAARYRADRQSRRKMAALERDKRQKDLQLEAVRLKAIPHFHANVLSSIEYYVMNKSSDEATHYLKLYSDFTNRTLADIDRPSRSIGEEIDYVRCYLELECLRYGERLDYSITVESGVDTNLQLPTMVLHTYCQNAVKHGIASKDGHGNIEVNICSQKMGDTGGVLVSVRDDGVGRSGAARSGGYSAGYGLKILQEQIELYNQTNKHNIIQRVTDLSDAQGKPCGTCFELWVPADYIF